MKEQRGVNKDKIKKNAGDESNVVYLMVSISARAKSTLKVLA